MDNVIEYKGYQSKVEYSKEDNVLHGKIEGIKDLVTFECESALDVRKEFEAAVDDYLDYCKSCNKQPDKSYKGSFNVRIAPYLHRAAALKAFKESKSLNEVVERAISEYLESTNCYSVSQLETSTMESNQFGFVGSGTSYTIMATSTND